MARPLHPKSKAVLVCASSSYLPGHAVLLILQLILKNVNEIPRHTPPYLTLAGSGVALDVQRWIKFYCKQRGRFFHNIWDMNTTEGDA